MNPFIHNKIKKVLSTLMLLTAFLLPVDTFAEESFPKTGNFYLHAGTSITEEGTKLLARQDLVVLPAEAQIFNQSLFPKLRALNPDIIILAYIPSTSFNFQYWTDSLHQKLLRGIQNDWWLKDASGNQISIWPGTEALNLATPWANYLAQYVKEDVMSTGLWNGIVFDEIDACASCKNNGIVDVNRDGTNDSAQVADAAWRAGVVTLLKETRNQISSDAIIMTNGSSATEFQPYTNGRMFESFPTPWEGGGAWNVVMENFRKISSLVKKPATFLFGGDSDNTGSQDYQDMRFGFGSALLAGAYFGYDFGTQSHGQLWWFDEYDVNLGKPTSSALNLKNPSSPVFSNGPWRRDFDNGIIILNSGESREKIRLGNDFEKLHGTQDSLTNDGAIVSLVNLNPEDALVLLKINEEIKGTSFENGSYVRIFNKDGSTARTGFFLFDPRFEGGATILKDDLDADGGLETIVAQNGRVKIIETDNSTRASFAPYGDAYHDKITIAAGDLDGNKYKEIVTGTGFGAGPHVLTWNMDGRLLHPGFFAFNYKLRGGVDVAIGDIDGDGKGEIITGVGRGERPLVRIYKNDSKRTLISEFEAYQSTFRGGINIEAGDVDGDGLAEIITGPNKGGGPHIRMFDGNGTAINKGFFAYESYKRDGVEVGAFDLDADGIVEILALTTSILP